MEIKKMNSSQFASATGINGASISHILSGRNNPSLEIALKILGTFPEISTDWLLSGKGEMYRLEIDKSNIGLDSSKPDVNNQLEISFAPKTNERQKVNEEEQTTKVSVNKEIIYVEKPVRKINEITVFYSDNSFETFVSKTSN
jgi:DNA-binding XRE family transcriptional regulator